VAIAIAVATCAVVAACSPPASDSRYVPQSLPAEASFPPVAQFLSIRCGSLDCHGAPARNLRLYGSAGRRALPTDQPFVPLCDTQAEVDLDYQGVVGLEPERMSAVVADHGADPDRLSMIAKARGDELHKGGQLWTAGDDADTCVLSWLSGTPNAVSCGRALDALVPNGTTNPVAACIAPP
jgi:hypothetical protein